MLINDNAKEIIKSRYLWLGKGETSWSDVASRIGNIVGAATNNPEYYSRKFTEISEEGLFIAGGRINRNAGRPRGSMFNCYGVPMGDSIEEIAEATAACMRLWKDGGGTGVPLGFLRPSQSPLESSEGFSSGPMPFLHGMDAMAGSIQTGGQRRAAGLSMMPVWHPDIVDFITYKNTDGVLKHFNLSVGINEEFLDSVRADREWPLIWANQVQKVVSAREIWDLIISGLIKNGEPGLINLDTIYVNNSYYYAPIIITNPCGEAPLEAWGCCNLGSLVLKHFVSGGRVQWKKLEETIHLGVRFLDHCIDINNYTLPQIKQTAQKGRRIGIGVMGLGDMLIDLKIRYGSEEALDFNEKLFKTIRNFCYEASIELAKERGAFPAFDPVLYSKSKFVRTLPPRIRSDIRKYGIRNVTTMAMAPTGTISLIPQCTSGIESLIYKAFKRSDNVSDRYYIHPLYREFLLKGEKAPDYLVDSTDLTPIEHIETQSCIQKYTDGAVSKTIMVPNNFTAGNLGDLLLESISDIKGITVYRDGSREGQPITPLTDKEALKVVQQSLDTPDLDEDAVACAKGTCET